MLGVGQNQGQAQTRGRQLHQVGQAGPHLTQDRWLSRWQAGPGLLQRRQIRLGHLRHPNLLHHLQQHLPLDPLRSHMEALLKLHRVLRNVCFIKIE